ncbi:MAG: DUF1614 domain-containing protein, partial [Gammaproteobacteria bacterium]|nr:DUF1614 domain-containing protein [Gammaproteobacteria bacterium]
MNNHMSPRQLSFFILLLIFLVSFIQVGALTLAFNKLGLSMESAFMLLLISLVGSLINLPLFKIKASAHKEVIPFRPFGLLHPRPVPFLGFTVIALNVGGGLVPIAFSIYLIFHTQLAIVDLLMMVVMISVISFVISLSLI